MRVPRIFITGLVLACVALAGASPAAAQRYVLALEEMSGSRISAIGVGPSRDAIVVRHDLLE